jgi:hypothetical protein
MDIFVGAASGYNWRTQCQSLFSASFLGGTISPLYFLKTQLKKCVFDNQVLVEEVSRGHKYLYHSEWSTITDEMRRARFR